MTAHKLLVVAAVLGVITPAWAQTPEEPGRGVARISLMNGDVSVRRGDSGDYVAAALNAPLVVQDRVLTGTASRGEVQFDWANFLRLSHNAEVRLAELEWRRYMVQLARGTVTWRVLRDQEANIEISTPSVSVRPVRKGTYRVTVLDDGSTQVTVRSGEAEIFTPRGSERLRSGRTMFVRGTAGDPEFRVGEEVPEDEWDRWNVARDRDLERSRSYQYVSRDIYGAEDLDHHGRWVHVTSYGWVWSPRVAVGWAPYRHGRWAWIDWYGWSWVSYDPWGWAPYHYGRWFYHGPVGWCWWPGAIGRRHYWSPGFVAFVGFGRVGVGFGWGRVGWIPLAPYEPYHPWYGRRWYGGYRNRGYVDNSVTVVNNVNVTNIYRNSRIDNAVTVVDNDNFRRGRFGDTIRVGREEIRTASLARGPLPVTPERGSLRLADRETSVRGVERAGSDRFFSNRKPAEVERVSFDDQRRGVEQIARRSFGEPAAGAAAVEGGRTATDGSRGERTAEQRGWRQVGETERGATASAGARSGDTSDRAISGGRGAEDSGRGASTAESRRVGSESAESSGAASTAGRGADAAGRGVSTGDWRRFGSSRAESSDAARGGGRAAENAGRGAAVVSSDASGRGAEDSGRGASTGDWRRFGSSRAESSDAARGDRRGADESGRGASTGDWRRFGSARVEGNDAGSGRLGQGEAATPREAPEGGVSSPRSESSDTPRGTGGGRGTEGSGRGASISDWRRFGSPRIESNDAGRGASVERGFGEPVTPREAPGRGASSGDWRRFDSGRGAETLLSEPSRGGGGIGTSESGRRFDGSRGGRSESSVTSGSGRDAGDWRRGPTAPSYDRGAEAPRMERRDWGGSWGGSRGGDRGDSIRISPPIVRERGGDFGGGRSYEGPRSAPSGGRGSFGGGMRGGGEGGGRSAPSAQSGGGRGGGTGGSRSGGGRGR